MAEKAKEDKMRKACEECGSKLTLELTVEVAKPIPEVVDTYERQFFSRGALDVKHFKRYFSSHQSFRTICVDCLAEQEKIRKGITALSDTSQAIAKRWLWIARRRLKGLPSRPGSDEEPETESSSDSAFEGQDTDQLQGLGRAAALGPVDDVTRKLLEQWLARAREYGSTLNQQSRRSSGVSPPATPHSVQSLRGVVLQPGTPQSVQSLRGVTLNYTPSAHANQRFLATPDARTGQLGSSRAESAFNFNVNSPAPTPGRLSAQAPLSPPSARFVVQATAQPAPPSARKLGKSAAKYAVTDPEEESPFVVPGSE